MEQPEQHANNKAILLPRGGVVSKLNPYAIPWKPTYPKIEKKNEVVTCNYSSSGVTLPLELESNILSRLPIKQLVRCKCVCKCWRDEINDSRFLKIYTCDGKNELECGSLILFQQPSLLLFDFHSPKKVINLSNHLHFCGSQVRLIGSSNGLLCFHDLTTRTRFWLHNPVTGSLNHICHLDLTPTEADFIENVGFGYDCISNDYKILCLPQETCVGQPNRVIDSRVYSLKNNSWKKVIHPILDDKYNRIGSQKCYYHMVASNNALHWTYTKLDEMKSRAIVSFDLGTEEYHEVPQPDDDEDYSLKFTDWVLSHLDGCLHLLKYCCKVGVYYDMRIWVMKKYGCKESWTKLVHVSLDRVIGREILLKRQKVSMEGCIPRACLFVPPMPYAYSKNGLEMLIGFGKYDVISFFRCHLQSGKLNKVDETCFPRGWNCTGFQVMPWFGSFASLSSLST